MNLETVIYEKRGAVALIKFNRPEVRNAFNAKMTEEILEALIEAKVCLLYTSDAADE